jgi:hypothetical protein
MPSISPGDSRTIESLIEQAEQSVQPVVVRNSSAMNASENSWSRQHPLTVACLLAVLSAMWLYALSGLTGLRPGVPLTVRTNVLFQSDCASTIWDYWDRDNHALWLRLEHPLYHWTYIAPTHLCYEVLRTRMADDEAVLAAGRGFVAAAAGIGIGCVLYVALLRGLGLVMLLPILMVNLFSTSMIIVTLPEHFGISYALLSMSFAVAAAELTLPTALGLLGILTVVTSGVTVTNGLFPVMAGAVVVWRRTGVRFPSWFLWTIGITGFLAVGGVAALGLTPGERLNPTIRDLRWKIGSNLNLRLAKNPAAVGAYAFRGLVDPVIGPTPGMDTNNWQNMPMVTYEPRGLPYRFWPYDGLQSAGAACWLILFLVACLKLIRSPDRMIALLLFSWIGFNLVFHNFWGDEFFLYSAHWSWALLAVVFLGARSYRSPWILLLCLPLVGAQIHTLTRIWASVALVPPCSP